MLKPPKRKRGDKPSFVTIAGKGDNTTHMLPNWYSNDFFWEKTSCSNKSVCVKTSSNGAFKDCDFSTNDSDWVNLYSFSHP